MELKHVSTTHIELTWSETEQLAETLSEILGQLETNPDDFGWSTEHRIFLELLNSKLLVNQG